MPSFSERAPDNTSYAHNDHRSKKPSRDNLEPAKPEQEPKRNNEVDETGRTPGIDVLLDSPIGGWLPPVLARASQVGMSSRENRWKHEKSHNMQVAGGRSRTRSRLPCRRVP